jgi:hypothetical protein
MCLAQLTSVVIVHQTGCDPMDRNRREGYPNWHGGIIIVETMIGDLAEVMLALGVSVFCFLSLVVPWSDRWLKPHRLDDGDDAANDFCPNPACPLHSPL